MLSCGVSISLQLHAAFSLEVRGVLRMVPTKLGLNWKSLEISPLTGLIYTCFSLSPFVFLVPEPDMPVALVFIDKYVSESYSWRMD